MEQPAFPQATEIARFSALDITGRYKQQWR